MELKAIGLEMKLQNLRIRCFSRTKGFPLICNCFADGMSITDKNNFKINLQLSSGIGLGKQNLVY